MMDRGYYTYLLRCSDGTLYCGWTVCLEERLRSHNAGTGAKYTRSRRPVEGHENRGEAMRREALIKRLKRQEKEELVRGFAVSSREEATHMIQ